MSIRSAWVLGCAGILLCVGCASSSSEAKPEPGVTVIRQPDKVMIREGLPPDKEAEVHALLQQRDASTRRCYNDVLGEKKDRAFKGSVKVLISLNTAGSAVSVKAIGGTLGDPGVEGCLVEALKTFEYPKLDAPGDVQYEFRFQPAY